MRLWHQLWLVGSGMMPEAFFGHSAEERVVVVHDVSSVRAVCAACCGVCTLCGKG